LDPRFEIPKPLFKSWVSRNFVFSRTLPDKGERSLGGPSSSAAP